MRWVAELGLVVLVEFPLGVIGHLDEPACVVRVEVRDGVSSGGCFTLPHCPPP